MELIATRAACQNYREADLRTNLRLLAIGLAIALGSLFGCQENAKPNSSQSAAPPPYLHILGDDEDVGSVVFVDKKQVAVLEGKFLSPVQTFIVVTPGRHLVEIRKNGELRVRSVVQVEANIGQMLLPARVNPPQSPDLTPDRPDP